MYCIIRWESYRRGRRRRACKELCKNTHVQTFGLIESFDSNSWFVLFSVYWCYSHEWFLSCYTFDLCAVYMISWLNWSLRGRKNEFYMFLYLSWSSCKECSRRVRKECIDRRLGEFIFCSHSPTSEVGHRSRARSVQAEWSSGLRTWVRVEGLLLQVCAG